MCLKYHDKRHKKFNYPTSTRAMVDGKRVYSINGEATSISYYYTYKQLNLLKREQYLRHGRKESELKTLIR